MFVSLTDRVHKFYSRSWRERRLFLEATLLSGLMRLLILTVPFRTIVSLFRLAERQPATSAIGFCLNKFCLNNISEISWAVQVASAYTPWKSNCLCQALTAMIMLSRIHIPCTLYLGVAKDTGIDESITAHAWLCSGESFITGDSVHKQYVVISSFSLPSD